MRIVFAGTPQFAATSLHALIHSHHTLLAVYTAPDKPAGRGLKLTASPVKMLANQSGIPVFQPTSFKSESVIHEFADLKPDIFIVAAYGFILPEVVLSIPHYGSVNIHASLLPRWRGAAPIQRCILAGDTESGITLMQMDAGLDTGDILQQSSFQLAPDETATSLHDKLSELASNMLLPFLDTLEKKEISPQKQNSASSTYAKKILKSESLMHFDCNAFELDRHVRGLHPTPGVCVPFQNQLLKIRTLEIIGNPNQLPPGTILNIDANSIHIACKENGVRLLSVQLPNKNSTTGGEFARQFKDICQIGTLFS